MSTPQEVIEYFLFVSPLEASQSQTFIDCLFLIDLLALKELVSQALTKS